MLPPIEPSISHSNPNFEALYRDLCTNKLNPNGTTKLDARAQKEHEAVIEKLHTARVAVARKELIKSNLSSLAYRESELPDELQELLVIITAALENPPSGEDADLLHEDIQKFKDNLPTLAPLITQSLEQDLSTLSRIPSPSSSASSSPSSLLPWISTKTQQISLNTSTLSSLRLQLSHSLTETSHLSLAVSETCIRILEQTLHGSVSRSSRAKADHLATVAEGMAKKLLLQHRKLLAATHSEELQEVVVARTRDLEREGHVLRRRIREGEERLEEFGTGRGRGMEGLAGEYAEILRETERREGEVERLRRRG